MSFIHLFLYCVALIEVVQAKSLAKIQIARFVDNPIIRTFQEYLQIDTSNQENIYHAVEFWRSQAELLGGTFRVLEPGNLPICVITVEGTDPTLPSIMLNSHMDVVPANAEDWTYPPFEAHIDENGDIFGRGTQDTKDVSIQYIEALKSMKKNNITLTRTLHMTLMPDEETGGYNGIIPFLNSSDFIDLNIGFAIDEGLAATDSTLMATYVDKRPWQMSFTFQGVAGHGSAIPNNTAVEQATRLLNQINAFREEQKLVANSHESTDFGSFTAINVNILSAGSVVNIIPNKVNMRVDMRLAASADPNETQNMVNSWISAAGSNITLEFIRHENLSSETAVDDTNPFWVAIQQVTTELDIRLLPVVCPATSDMLHVRNKGIPAIGLAPKFHTTSRIHGIDEYLNAATFLNGIDFYVTLLTRLGNVA